jgi:hypothetical protein
MYVYAEGACIWYVYVYMYSCMYVGMYVNAECAFTLCVCVCMYTDRHVRTKGFPYIKLQIREKGSESRDVIPQSNHELLAMVQTWPLSMRDKHESRVRALIVW